MGIRTPAFPLQEKQRSKENKMLKIAVYAISKNEEKHCERWVSSCKGADGIFCLDTGSTDKTVELMRSLGVTVSEKTFDPWRFDDARNCALAMIPNDFNIAIVLDIDEVLCDGWREKVERLWNSNPATTELRHLYAWSPKHIFSCSRFHSVKNYKWIKPVHEVQVHEQNKPVPVFTQDVLVLHFPDSSKSRGQYIDLLKKSVEEDPLDPRNSFYYGRELYYYKRWSESAAEFMRYLDMDRPKAAFERSAACVFVSECRLLAGHSDEESWLLRACAEDTNRRESWFRLGEFYRRKDAFNMGYACAKRALSISRRPFTFLDDESVWSWRVHDLASVCAFYIGKKQESLDFSKYACAANPGDARLVKNHEIISRYVES